MQSEVLTGAMIELPDGRDAWMAIIEGGYAIQLSVPLNGIISQEQLDSKPTCISEFRDGKAVTHLRLSEECLHALQFLLNELKLQRKNEL